MEKTIKELAGWLFYYQNPDWKGKTDWREIPENEQEKFMESARVIIAMFPLEEIRELVKRIEVYAVPRSALYHEKQNLDQKKIRKLCGEIDNLIPTGSKPDKGCKCQSCGKEFKMDLEIDNETWEIIRPEEKSQRAGLLCPHCIIERIISLGEYCTYRLIVVDKPKQDELPEGKQPGLFRKYVVYKTDGSPAEPGAKYFVLRGDKDRHAKAALKAYADSVQSENPEFANDIMRFYFPPSDESDSKRERVKSILLDMAIMPNPFNDDARADNIADHIMEVFK